MENVKNVILNDNKPKELIKPMRVEEVLATEKVVEGLCESRNWCVGSNSAIGVADDILF